ncbi:MAG: Rpn family recombination-promoting nuclease/putative transposase [Lachnobacterium sp.]|nr:Rpn family recombination-promoting nuclease/putative transposase [Lachnobacterium sp.]
MNHQKIQNQIATDIPTGKLPFRMTSDILFKILMQSSTKVLKGIVCSYLDLSPEIIKSIEISNPISLKEDISGKEMILDVKAILNDKTIINLEMQVVNYQDWPERSLSYLCRCFDNLGPGHGYLHVKGAVHIGFLDYTLFPDSPEFYATYRMINERTGQLYSSKFRISVVDLTKRNLATEEDIAHHRDLWAAFFKATEWGEVMALAKKDKNISEAVVTLKKLSDDEIFKMRYQAREDMLRQELDMQYYYTNQLNAKDAELAKQYAELTEQSAELARQASELADKDAILAEYKRLYGELK